jgi:hypothetical protein
VLHAFSLLVVRNIGFAYNAQKGKNCLFKISCLVLRCYVGGFFFRMQSCRTHEGKSFLSSIFRLRDTTRASHEK